jgi:hypothetical protein
VPHLAMLPGHHGFISCLVAANFMHHCIQLPGGGGMACLATGIVPAGKQQTFCVCVVMRGGRSFAFTLIPSRILTENVDKGR